MGKKVSSTFDSPVDVETLYAVLTAPDWAATKAAHFKDDSTMVRRDVADGDAVTLVVSRKLPPGVPGFLQTFLPSDQRVTTSDVWGTAAGGERRATWTAVIAGAPAKLGGTMRIEPIPGGSRYTISGEVKVSVPLIGGKAESFIAEAVLSLADSEAGLVQQVLAARA